MQLKGDRKDTCWGRWMFTALE